VQGVEGRRRGRNKFVKMKMNDDDRAKLREMKKIEEKKKSDKLRKV